MITDENNYSFDAFLSRRASVNCYTDNSFFRNVITHFTGELSETLNNRLMEFSHKSTHTWRNLIEEMAKIENRPRLQQYDAFNRRVDRVVLSKESELLTDAVFKEGLFSDRTDKWEKIIKEVILYHNGEANTMCPLLCTDGLISLIEEFADSVGPELQDILQHCKEGIDGDFGVGAQFLTEIQGGSDVRKNVLKAVPEGDNYRLYGSKFFCSAIHADYAVVTARVKDSDHIGVFIVPSWLPGDKEKEKRNGYKINRLKTKMGTCELPSGEIHYQGALAYPIGSPEKGISTITSIVLTKSRLGIGISSSAFLMRMAQEALLYSEFREAFGRTIGQFPLMAGQLQTIELTAKRTLAGAFKVYDQYFKTQETMSNSSTDKLHRFAVRELILLQKIVSSHDTVSIGRLAISTFGGNGVIEDWSSIPRLYRDAMVNELWEGPKNVLLTQIFRDFQRAMSWLTPKDFIATILPSLTEEKSKSLASTMEELLEDNNLSAEVSHHSINAAEAWENLCFELFREYQNQALAEVEDAPLLIDKQGVELPC